MKPLRQFILVGITYGVLTLFVLFSLHGNLDAAEPVFGTLPSFAPQLSGFNFECSDPDRLTPWTIHLLDGSPIYEYARERYGGSCGYAGWVEHLEGRDALVIVSEDIEQPPLPGKPFDIALSQRFSATAGVDYSVSGWMVSLCAGSAVPNNCPDGYYIAKRLGLDPKGDVDPNSSNIVWTENRQNFIENDERVGWINLRTAVRADASNMTVFARVTSPFQWHGNHAFLDSISVVRAPIARFDFPSTSVSGDAITLTWLSEQSPDISAIADGAYQLYVDIEARQLPKGEWKPVVSDAVGVNELYHKVKCINSSYEFRIRAHSEQSPGLGPGVFPNHRYPGVWSDALVVQFSEAASAQAEKDDQSDLQSPEGSYQVFLPLVSRQILCLD